jgi:ribosomal protein S20
MSMPRLLGFSGAIVMAAIIGGTLISAVVAAPAATGPSGPTSVAAAPSASPATAAAAGEYCERYRAEFAKALGVSEADVTAAAKAAANATIDDAVADGKLPAAAADRLKARVAAADPDICQRIAKRLGAGKAALGVVRHAMTAAADALGMTPAELRKALADGASLKTIAGDKSVDYATVTKAVLGAVKADLDAAVKAGTIKQAREDRILERLTKRLENGAIRGG